MTEQIDSAEIRRAAFAALKSANERIMSWAERAPGDRAKAVSMFATAGGKIWIEGGEIRASLDGVSAREPLRADDDHHHFLAVLRWAEISQYKAAASIDQQAA